MFHRVIAAVLTVLICVSPLTANSAFLADCQDQSCCCKRAVMAGHTENADMIKAQSGGCCHETAGSTCSLTTVGPVKNIDWAVSANRVDFPSNSDFGYINDDHGPITPQVIFRTDAGGDAIHLGSPPIYLSAMSFLC